MLIDLHSHSTHSDGSYSPVLLVQAAIAMNLSYFAITDHDNVDSIETLKNFKFPTNFTYIPGVEITTKSSFDGEIYHLVVLFPEEMKSNLSTFRDIFDQQKTDRTIRMELLWEQVNLKYNLSYNYATFLDYFNTLNSSQVQKVHFAKFLVQEGICTNVNDCFKSHLNIVVKSGDYLVTEDMVKLARQSRAYPILAHPFSLAKNKSTVLDFIRLLSNQGLKAIEVEHPDLLQTEKQSLRELADELGIMYSIGGDYHGPEREVKGYLLGNIQGNQDVSNLRKLAILEDMGYSTSTFSLPQGIGMSIALLSQIAVVIYMACRN